jgi:poly-gamma-glutamate capsule biosynthesis protein CapA/YwtB (metallophosphatase superfamily)
VWPLAEKTITEKTPVETPLATFRATNRDLAKLRLYENPRSEVRTLFSRLLFDLNTHAFDFLIQGRKWHVETLRGFGLVPVALLQHVQDDAAFAVLDDVEEGSVATVF